MDSKVLSSVYHKVRDACLQPANFFGFGIWSHHIRPMIESAKELAPLYNADLEMVLLCVLLHDYAGISNEALIEEHHKHGADEARRILSAHAYPVERIAIISGAILAYRPRLHPRYVHSLDEGDHLGQIALDRGRRAGIVIRRTRRDGRVSLCITRLKKTKPNESHLPVASGT